MAKKFYAVKIGTNPGIYTKWSDCEKNTKGFSGSIFKAFSTEKEAEKFLGINVLDEEVDDGNIFAQVAAYVDGSYEDTNKQYSYGVVIIHNGKESCFSEKFSNQEFVGMRNVAGEIEGSKRAMKYCLDNNLKSLDIFFDYEGIEKWCTGEWRVKKNGTKKYKEYYDDISKKVEIRFIKVKSHSGDKYNDMADKLAKEALGLIEKTTPISHNSNGIVVNKIKYEDFIAIIDLLKEEFIDMIHIKENIPYGVEHKLSIQHKNKRQKLTISCYEGKDKICIKGEKEDLFNKLSSYIVELLELDEIPAFLNTIHNLKVDYDVVENEFNTYFPNSYNLIPNELKNYLHQAVYNLHIVGNVFTSNFLVEPAVRPLEGILKIALQNAGISNRNKDSFSFFEKVRDRYELNKTYVQSHHSDDLLNYLSECYTYYNKNRHTLFHWDDPNRSPDTTRILKTVDEAHNIIKDSISIIDKYYKIVN